MKACIPQNNVPGCRNETIKWYETDQYIKKEERKKLEKLRAAVCLSFIPILSLWDSRIYFHAQMEKKKAELVRISPSTLFVGRSVCDT